MKAMLGGELYDSLTARNKYEEELASDIISQILRAVAYLHSNDIVHRNL